jgi:hypothetical protein
LAQVTHARGRSYAKNKIKNKKTQRVEHELRVNTAEQDAPRPGESTPLSEFRALGAITLDTLFVAWWVLSRCCRLVGAVAVDGGAHEESRRSADVFLALYFDW